MKTPKPGYSRFSQLYQNLKQDSQTEESKSLEKKLNGGHFITAKYIDRKLRKSLKNLKSSTHNKKPKISIKLSNSKNKL